MLWKRYYRRNNTKRYPGLKYYPIILKKNDIMLIETIEIGDAI